MKPQHTTAARLAAGVAALIVGLSASLPAAGAADPIDFFGTFMNTNPTASPAPPCAAQVINKHDPPTFKSAGFSNLGDFVFNLAQCLAPVPSGSIELDFGGGNTLFGTWASVGTSSSTPLVTQVVGSAGIAGGTGTFAGYTGSFTALGNLDRRAVADDFLAGSAFVFRGEVTPVPEASTWALWLAGVAGIARRRGQLDPVDAFAVQQPVLGSRTARAEALTAQKAAAKPPPRAVARHSLPCADEDTQPLR